MRNCLQSIVGSVGKSVSQEHGSIDREEDKLGQCGSNRPDSSNIRDVSHNSIKCSKCSEGFVSLESMKAHSHTHTIKQSFKCVRALYGADDDVFYQQDGAPPHYHLAVRAFLDDNLQEHWIGRRGPIEFPPSETLLKAKLLGSYPIKVERHSSLNTTWGVVHTGALDGLSDVEIQQELAEQSVSKACRLLLRCFRCQRFGHTQKRCTNNIICSQCGIGNHGDSPCPNAVHCVNCDGDHSSNSKDCPKYITEKAIQELRIKDSITFFVARKRFLEDEKERREKSYASVLQKAKEGINMGTQTPSLEDLTGKQTETAAQTFVDATTQTDDSDSFGLEIRPYKPKKIVTVTSQTDSVPVRASRRRTPRRDEKSRTRSRSRSGSGGRRTESELPQSKIVMEVIKKEPEGDPLAIKWNDNTNTDEKKLLSEGGIWVLVGDELLLLFRILSVRKKHSGYGPRNETHRKKSPLCILCYFKMNDVIDNPADCEVRSVIRFLNARHLKPAEIYRQLKEVYGDTVMNERNVRKWCEMFNNGQTNVHDETQTGRPSLITEDLKTKVNDRILQDRRTSLDELHIAFPDISRSLLGEIVSQHLGYHKICARPHTAASTRQLLDQFGWEIFDHPPYSPDLAPSDFHLFTKLKDFLGGTRFGSDEELKKTVNTWLNELAAEKYNTGILKLVNRYDK
ncbi:hypothetical protein ANN_27846 [Periplaneta americana]|uniref:Uncharacterized protein n=1 Tax=Periplaneta americana TaxID=6978 RepID=A0ABQ8RVE3_PERAM|nr:hypothetical protein ANN_27846 [Periplaneta americana]